MKALLILAITLACLSPTQSLESRAKIKFEALDLTSLSKSELVQLAHEYKSEAEGERSANASIKTRIAFLEAFVQSMASEITRLKAEKTELEAELESLK